MSSYPTNRVGFNCRFSNHLRCKQTNEYLKTEAGDSSVQIEQRPPGKSSFGTGKLPKLRMSFGEFLQRMQNNEHLYLTTQYEEDDDDGNNLSESGAIDNPLQVC